MTIDHVSFDVPEGSYTTIIGHNGSGKSTIAKLLAGLLEKASGSIRIDGLELNLENLAKIRSRIGIVFQNPDNQFIGATVEDDIAFGLENHNVPQADMQEIIKHSAERVRMTKYLHQEPTRLSGGQKQRISIARALIMNPKLLICDEVVSALDVSIQGQIINMLSDLQEKRNLSYVFITHDLRVACFFCDTIAVMYRGVLVEQGEAKDFYRNALHPYTKLLFEGASVNLNNSSLEIKSVLQSETSCPFSHRCPKATEKCRTEKPELKSVSQNQKVRCFYI